MIIYCLYRFTILYKSNKTALYILTIILSACNSFCKKVYKTV